MKYNNISMAGVNKKQEKKKKKKPQHMDNYKRRKEVSLLNLAPWQI